MKKIFIPVMLLLFILINMGIFVLQYNNTAFQWRVLVIGNSIMALLSLVTFLMIVGKKAVDPHAFVRGVSGASFLKLTVCMTGILIYILMLRPNVHKPSIFVLLGIYALYSIVETIILSKWARAGK